MSDKIDPSEEVVVLTGEYVLGALDCEGARLLEQEAETD